jgi:adenylosuccinate synthase
MLIPKDGKAAFIVVDLGYGDAGKGTITDHLVRTRGAHTVIRFNGGAQAAHNVVAPDGRQHVFSQFGAGTLVPGVRTHLSRFMVLNPIAMLAEDARLRTLGVTDAFARTGIDREALVITPYQRAANRLREIARGAGRHGSVGMGVGETASDALEIGGNAVRVADLADPALLARKLRWMRDFKRAQRADVLAACAGVPAAQEELAWFEDGAVDARYMDAIAAFMQVANVTGRADEHAILDAPGTVVFEGSQGVLIDEWRGFHPYTTWSTCTFDNALALLKEHSYAGEVTKLGVVRAYGTRHGPGPFVPEDAAMTAALPDAHNKMDAWQGAFRVGWLDIPATRYAIAACGGIDALAVTCLDRLAGMPEWRLCDSYRLPEDVSPADARLFFGTDGDVAETIVPGPFTDLDHQERLTRILERSRPRLAVSASHPHADVRAAEHVRAIARALGVRVRVASFGPSATDKREL